jgi:hypothetical protein
MTAENADEEGARDVACRRVGHRPQDEPALKQNGVIDDAQYERLKAKASALGARRWWR